MATSSNRQPLASHGNSPERHIGVIVETTDAAEIRHRMLPDMDRRETRDLQKVTTLSERTCSLVCGLEVLSPIPKRALFPGTL
ncbi:hypothetical protein VTO73DRAFT_649 [Trametes versicolor]